MSGATSPVSVRVLDREYTVGVGEDERDSLAAAARELEGRMREIRGSNKMVALDRLAVLAALNLAHDLEQLRDANARRERELARLVAQLSSKLDALADAG